MVRAALLLALTASAALSQGFGLPPLTDRFATCTGRLSAMMEYQWLADDPATDETTDQLALMRDLLTAVSDPDAAGLVLSRENEAKLGFERLLSRFEAEGGSWAQARAEALLDECRALLF